MNKSQLKAKVAKNKIKFWKKFEEKLVISLLVFAIGYYFLNFVISTLFASKII